LTVTECKRLEDVFDDGERNKPWETRAARKIRKRGRNRTSKNKNKSPGIRLINSPKESLDRRLQYGN